MECGPLTEDSQAPPPKGTESGHPESGSHEGNQQQ